MKTAQRIQLAFGCILACFSYGTAQSENHHLKDELIQTHLHQSFPLDISVFNLGTFLPGGGKAGIWSSTIHPGFDIGTRYYWRRRPKSDLFQATKTGYFRHAHAQHGIQLYTGLSYQQFIGEHFFATGKIGAGYLASIPDMQVFTFENGQYTRSKKFRSQFMGELTIDVGWRLSSQFDLYLSYQFWVQAPFVNKYVPILPNNAIHLGLVFYHNWFTKTH